MINNNYSLTKTKILSGLQCHKKLWYDFHQQISKDNHSIHIGNRFGEEVKKKYKDGYGKFKDSNVNQSFNRISISKNKTLIIITGIIELLLHGYLIYRFMIYNK